MGSLSELQTAIITTSGLNLCLAFKRLTLTTRLFIVRLNEDSRLFRQRRLGYEDHIEMKTI